MAGLFIDTQEPQPSGRLTRLEYLVAEGQVRADAIVRHSKAGAGPRLKLTALGEKNRPKLSALISRLRKTQHFLAVRDSEFRCKPFRASAGVRFVQHLSYQTSEG